MEERFGKVLLKQGSNRRKLESAVACGEVGRCVEEVRASLATHQRWLEANEGKSSSNFGFVLLNKLLEQSKVMSFDFFQNFHLNFSLRILSLERVLKTMKYSSVFQ